MHGVVTAGNLDANRTVALKLVVGPNKHAGTSQQCGAPAVSGVLSLSWNLVSSLDSSCKNFEIRGPIDRSVQLICS